MTKSTWRILRTVAVAGTLTMGGAAFAQSGGSTDPDRDRGTPTDTSNAAPTDPAAKPGENVPDHSPTKRSHDRRKSPGGGYDQAGKGTDAAQTPQTKK
jgi:hypothetical protein